MFLGILVISVTCIVDDIKTIKPITKLIGQLLAAIVAVGFGVRIEDTVQITKFGCINLTNSEKNYIII